MVSPFIGENYRTTAPPLGLPIMVLGESSYNSNHPPCRRGERLSPDWNNQIIDCVRTHKKDNTITRAAGVFYGEWRSWDQRREFWQSSAFANFVQVDMGCHGQRPTSPEWDGGRGPFQGYLNELKPGFVLALGAELWAHLPHPCDHGKVHNHEEPPKPYYLYEHGGGCSFVFGINHPISRGWSYAKWTPWVRAALETARVINCG